MNWNQWLRDWLNLLFYTHCPLCSRPAAQVFCQDCLRQLRTCQYAQPQQFWQGSLPVFPWGMYREPLRQAIAQLKYHRQPQIARSLGQWLGMSWLKLPASGPRPIVVPIPLHPEKQKQRGYNQANLIARSFCAVTGLPLRSRGLQRLRQTEAQHKLSAKAREQNLIQAFDLGPDLRRYRSNRPILLLDDIYTTGATVRSAAEILNRSGLQVHGLVVVAKTERR